ncbi:MAG: hypothetical protein JWO60_3378 [Frankiales bacterium]|nr:hypothetical protein [Frankiales bacterium]
MRTPLPVRPALALVGALALTACGSSNVDAAATGKRAASSDLSIGVGYFQSATTGPEVVVAGNQDLAGEIDGTLKLTPIDSGVAGLATLRGGAFPFVSGVGNPPVVGAIANGTKLKVVFAEYFDAAQLVVPPSVKTDADLAGTTIGALQGSSEDFEIRGWLSTKGLTDKTEVIGFPSEAAIGAAYKAGRIDAAYAEIAQAIELKKTKGARQVVTAKEIAELGFPSLNVLAVTDAFAQDHPEVVQQVVCQVMRAQTKVASAEGDTYITNAGKLVGATAEQAVPATKVLPFVPADEQLSWFKDGGPTGDLATGRIAKSYALTAQFLKDQGRVPTVPTTEQIVSHLDSSYVEQALEDGCDA